VISFPSPWKRGQETQHIYPTHRTPGVRHPATLSIPRDRAPRRASTRGARRHGDRLQRCSACSRGDSAGRAAGGVGAGPHGWARDHVHGGGHGGGSDVEVEVDARVAGAVGAGQGD